MNIALIFVALALFILLLLAVWTTKALQFHSIKKTSKHAYLPTTSLLSTLNIIYDILVNKKHAVVAILENVNKNEPCAHLSLVFISTVFVFDADTLKSIFLNNKHYPKPDVQRHLKAPFLRRIFGDNISIVNGEQWKKQRMVMDPAFYHLEMFVEPFSNKIRECLRYFDLVLLKKEMDPTNNSNCAVTATLSPSSSSPHIDTSAQIDILSFMEKMTLDILGLTAFGYDFGFLKEAASEAVDLQQHAGSTTKGKSAGDEKARKFMDAYHYAMDHSFNVMHFILPFTSSLPTKANRMLTEKIDDIDKFIYHLINECKEKLQSGHQPAHLLDLMVQSYLQGDAENRMTEKELRDNVLVVFLAGHETTVSSLCFSLYSLAKYPHVQEKLCEEIQSVFGNDEAITYQKVMSCNYMLNVIQETMRMFPPVLAIARECDKDEEYGGYRIPKGTMVTIPIQAVHHDERYWDNPSEFNPDRFSAEQSKSRHRFAYLSFASGARKCIGSGFSTLQQRLFLVLLLQRFKVELPDHNYTVKIDNTKFLLHPTPDFRLVLKKRR